MKIFRLMFAVIFLFHSTLPAFALAAAEPGKSLWGFSLGAGRNQAVQSAKKRWPKAKRQKTVTYKEGVVEDAWDIPIGDDLLKFEIFSQKGKIIQLRTWTSSERGQTNRSFAQLLRRHRLQKTVYGFDDPNGGGYVGFYYDDVKRGVCFTAGVQDNFLLTSRPDGLIIHRPGVPAIGIENGLRGKRVTGRAARAFANEAEARRVEEHEQNDY